MASPPPSPHLQGQDAQGQSHEHQGEGGAPQFDHYAIQTPAHKLIRLELHAGPEALHSDWRQRCQTILLRAGRDPGELAAGTVVRELYDLRGDPGEHRSLLRADASDEARAIATDLEVKLDAWIEDTRAAAVAAS